MVADCVASPVRGFRRDGLDVSSRLLGTGISADTDTTAGKYWTCTPARLHQPGRSRVHVGQPGRHEQLLHALYRSRTSIGTSCVTRLAAHLKVRRDSPVDYDCSHLDRFSF